MQVMVETALSHMVGVSVHVGLLMTRPLYTDTLLPPPSRFCVERNTDYCLVNVRFSYHSLADSHVHYYLCHLVQIQPHFLILYSINLTVAMAITIWPHPSNDNILV